MTNLQNLRERAINGLQQLKLLLEVLDDKTYVKPIKHLNNSSIGEHTRHILELYLEFLKGLANHTINYDSRKRNRLLESVPQEAIYTIEEIQTNIPLDYKELRLQFTCQLTKGLQTIESNINRELLYNIEHTVHHLALIRVALIELNIDQHIDKYFGYADSTVIYKESQKSN